MNSCEKLEGKENLSKFIASKLAELLEKEINDEKICFYGSTTSKNSEPPNAPAVEITVCEEDMLSSVWLFNEDIVLKYLTNIGITIEQAKNSMYYIGIFSK